MGDALVAGTVGTWVCEVDAGTVITAGLRIGRLRQARRWHPLLAPEGALGHTVASVVSGPQVVEHGSALLTLGESPVVETGPGEGTSEEEGLVAVQVGMTGALYRRPAPNKADFAPVGAEVQERAVVALIEVMKTYNPIKVSQAGRIERWLVEDGETVESGTVILLLRPL